MRVSITLTSDEVKEMFSYLQTQGFKKNAEKLTKEEIQDIMNQWYDEAINSIGPYLLEDKVKEFMGSYK